MFYLLLPTIGALLGLYFYGVGYARRTLLGDAKPINEKSHRIGRGGWPRLDCRGPVGSAAFRDDRCVNCAAHYDAKRRAWFWPLLILAIPFRCAIKAGEQEAEHDPVLTDYPGP